MSEAAMRGEESSLIPAATVSSSATTANKSATAPRTAPTGVGKLPEQHRVVSLVQESTTGTVEAKLYNK